MRYDLHDKRHVTSINRFAVSCGCNYHALFLLLCVSFLTGCVGSKFHNNFSAMAVQPPQPAHPLVGAYLLHSE